MISGGVFGDANKKATEHALKDTQTYLANQATMLAWEAATNTALLNPTLALSTQSPIPGFGAPISSTLTNIVPPAAAVPPATQPLPSPTPLDEIAKYLENGYCAVKVTLEAGKSITESIKYYYDNQWHSRGVQVKAPMDKLVVLDLLDNKPSKPRKVNGKYVLLCRNRNNGELNNNLYSFVVNFCDEQLQDPNILGDFYIAILIQENSRNNKPEDACKNIHGNWEPTYVPTGTQY